MRFFKEILRAPHITGAIAPSSPWLARLIVDKARVSGASRILELGPGTGVMTRRILEQKSRGARFVAVERNPNFVTTLRSLFPNLHVVTGCASKLKSHAVEHDFHGADSIVSGLPWAIFDPPTQRSILSGIYDVLSADGIFATFAYFGPHWLPAGQTFRDHLKRQFATVRTSRVVLANLPPAFVYYCGK